MCRRLVSAAIGNTYSAASCRHFVDMIVQSYGSEDLADITFTMPRAEFDLALAEATKVGEQFQCERIEVKKEIAKLSVSGIGLRSHTGVAIGMFEALANAKINMEAINTSEVRVNVVVAGSDGDAGLVCLREQFAESLK